MAGQGAGFEKGSGTRSGLLWEVERILNECKASDCLPQVLLMENVPQVCGSSNIKPWGDWLNALHELGYTNYFDILNAKDYGIPQNRRRCFMVSILGQASYTMPHPFKLRYRLKDFIKKKVDKKYYLSDELVKGFQEYNERQKDKGLGFKFEPQNPEGGEFPELSSQDPTESTETTSRKIRVMNVSEDVAKTIVATQQKDHARDNTYVPDEEVE